MLRAVIWEPGISTGGLISTGELTDRLVYYHNTLDTRLRSVLLPWSVREEAPSQEARGDVGHETLFESSATKFNDAASSPFIIQAIP
jgi:hypothetical protein